MQLSATKVRFLVGSRRHRSKWLPTLKRQTFGNRDPSSEHDTDSARSHTLGIWEPTVALKTNTPPVKTTRRRRRRRRSRLSIVPHRHQELYIPTRTEDFESDSDDVIPSKRPGRISRPVDTAMDDVEEPTPNPHKSTSLDTKLSLNIPIVASPNPASQHTPQRKTRVLSAVSPGTPPSPAPGNVFRLRAHKDQIALNTGPPCVAEMVPAPELQGARRFQPRNRLRTVNTTDLSPSFAKVDDPFTATGRGISSGNTSAATMTTHRLAVLVSNPVLGISQTEQQNVDEPPRRNLPLRR